jgi:hypothetical protein
MDETSHSDARSDVPWTTSNHRLQVADTSMLPGSEKATPPVVDLLNHAVQGAHNTIDRLADSAAPVARHLSERASAAEDALHAKSGQLRETRDEWMGNMRTTVRSHPLAWIAAAVALGAAVARITR